MTNLTNNKAVLSWIDEMTAITKPDKIVWITGEEEQLDALREQAVKDKESKRKIREAHGGSGFTFIVYEKEPRACGNKANTRTCKPKKR